MSLYRIIQELINNTLKYAGATKMEINSTLKENELMVTLEHNGNGLSQEDFDIFSFRKEGLGLKNIRNRVLLLKGKISFDKTPEASTIHISLPV